MATTQAQLRRELLVGIRDAQNEIDRLIAQLNRDIARAARQNRTNQRNFERQVLIALGAFWAAYRLLQPDVNAQVASSVATYVDNTVGKSLLKVGANQEYLNQIAVPPTAQRPKGNLQLQLEAAHNRGDVKEEARLNKLVDASMRTDAGMDTKVREEFLKAMRAGKPITMEEAKKRAGSSALPKYGTDKGAAVLKRVNPYDKGTIEHRIVTLKRGNERIVRAMVRQGFKDGLTVNQVARSIQNYVNPMSQAGMRFTAGNGINYKAVQAGKNLPKGAIRYNAVRIARTEMMLTYDQAMYDYYNGKPWSRGWKWLLSNTHAGYDDCDVLAKGSPYKKPQARPHPQCTCDQQPDIIGLDEFERLVKNGSIK